MCIKGKEALNFTLSEGFFQFVVLNQLNINIIFLLCVQSYWSYFIGKGKIPSPHMHIRL